MSNTYLEAIQGGRAAGFLSRWAESRAEYDAARDSRFRRRRTGVGSLGTDADYHYRSERDFLTLIEFARDVERNDQMVGQGVRRVADTLIRTGFTIDMQTGDEEADEYLGEKLRQWALQPDLCSTSGRFTLDELAYLTELREIVDGDCFVILDENSDGVELVEAHRCRTPFGADRSWQSWVRSLFGKRRDVPINPRIVHGIVMGENRAPYEYWFARESASLWEPVRLDDVSQISARHEPIEDGGLGGPRVLHLYDPRRYSQTRGVTAMAPILNSAGAHDDLTFAQLIRSLLQASYALVIETPAGDPALTTASSSGSTENSGRSGEREINIRSDGSREIIDGIRPGMSYIGKPGEKLIPFTPQTGGSEYAAFNRVILTYLAANLDLPVAAFTLDASDTNFSGWRGAEEKAKVTWVRRQKRKGTQFYCQTLRWKLRQFANPNNDRFDRKCAEFVDRLGWDAYLRMICRAPAQSYIQPEVDVKADVTEIRNGVDSPRGVLGKRGREWSTVIRETVDDIGLAVTLAKAKADEINSLFGEQDPVHWRELVRIPLAEGQQQAVTPPTVQDTSDNRAGGGENK